MIVAAVAVQIKGRGRLLFSLMYWVIARISSDTLRKVPRRILLLVISENQRSTRFSHDELVGTKWRWNLG